MKRLIVGALVAAAIMAACGGSSGGESRDALVIYSGRSEELVAPLIEDFESSSGIDVEVRYADSGELAATLLAEGATTEADIFFAQDPASLGAASGLMSELPAQTLGLVEPRFQDGQGRWIGTSGRVRVVAHNIDSDIPLPRPSMTRSIRCGRANWAWLRPMARSLPSSRR